MTGWRLCTGRGHVGPRWCRVTDFGYRGWDPLRDEPARLASRCFACERERQKATRPAPAELLVDATTFRGWLSRRVAEESLSVVASSLGVHPRRVTIVLAQSQVRLSTVDRWAAAFGDNSTILGY